MTERRPSPRILAVLVLLGAVGAAVLLHANRNGYFFFDEWDFILRRRGMNADALLAPHNGHLSAVPVAAYKVMLQLFGLDPYWPYRFLLVLVHLTAVALLFTLVRRRTGDAIAVCGAVLLLFLGAAGDDVLWAFQIGFVGSVVAGLGMLIALDQKSRRGDVAAAVLLGVTLACSSVGVPFAVICVVDVLARRSWRRLLTVVAPPFALYGAWRLGYAQSDLQIANVDDAPAFAYAMLTAAGGGLTGVPAAAPVAALALIIGGAVVIGRDLATPRFFAVLAGAASYMLLTALARAQFGEPGAPRYVYPLVVFLLLGAAEAWPTGLRVGPRALATVAGLVVVVVVGNLLLLNQIATSLSSNASSLRGSLVALDLARAYAAPGYQPAPTADPQVTAGPYLEAKDDFVGLGGDEIGVLPDASRREADRVLTELEVGDEPVATPRASTCRIVSGGDFQLPGGSSAVLVAPDDAGLELRLRRFGADVPAAPYGGVAAGRAVRLTFARDDDATPWTIRAASSAPWRLC